MSTRKVIHSIVLLCLLGYPVNQAFAQRVEGSYFPISTRPDKLYLISGDLPYSHKISMLTLAGLLAKTKPELLWEIGGHRELAEKEGIIIDRTYFGGDRYPALLEFYASRLDGYILCTGKERSVNVAVSLASSENAVVIPEDMESVAIDAGLTMVLDVRGKDEIWMMDNYASRFNKNIASYQAYMDDRATALQDFTVYTGAAQFWDDSPTGPYATKVYANMNTGAVFMGYVPDEFVSVNELSSRSFSLIPSDWARNLSTLCNIPVPIKKQQAAVTPYKVVPNVHTVCFVLSDGDNLAWTSGSFNDVGNFSNPIRAKINMGYTITPSLVELAPTVYNKYVEYAISTPTGRNVLIAGPSGSSYLYPTPHTDLANEMKKMNRYLKMADLHIVNVIDKDNAHNPDPYLRQPNVDALFYYSYGAQYTGLKGEIKWYKDKPSIAAREKLWGGGDRLKNDAITSTLATELNKKSTDINSADGYSLVPVHVWSMNVSDVYNTITKLNPNIRVVAPDEFVWLIRKNLKNLPLGNGNGLIADYFTGYNFGALQYTEANQTIDFDWGTLSPNTDKLGNDQFSVRWSGQIMPLYSEEYTFYTNSDDGVKLIINGETIIDGFATDGAPERNGKITLTAGQKYDIKLEYGEKGGNAFCTLDWESTSQARQVVPRDQLFSHPSSVGGVTFYDDCNYQGIGAGLYAGNFTLADLVLKGIPDNNISSVKVAKGYKAIAYTDDNFTGESLSVTADKSCLATGHFDNKISSIKVVANGITNMEGPFFLKNRNSGLYIDVVGGPGNTYDGPNIQQWNIASSTNQSFRFINNGDGTVHLQAVHSGKVVSAMGMLNGTGFKQSAYAGLATQKFILLKNASDNYYKIFVASTGKLIDVENASTKPDVLLMQNDDTDQLSAQWELVSAPDVPAGGDGLTGNYFAGMNFETPLFTRRDPVIYFNWDQGAPGSNMNTDGYSIRWTGKIKPKYDGEYTFYITSDNGRRLWVNDQLIIDKWINDWAVEYSGTITLTADQKYDIKLEYFEDGGGADIALSWSHASQPQQIIPEVYLYSTIPDEVCTDCEITAVNEFQSNRELRVYPNPTKDDLTFPSMAKLKTISYTITNATGERMATASASTNRIEVSYLNPGIYVISIWDGKQYFRAKFIKQ